jgi:hypothetical protein
MAIHVVFSMILLGLLGVYGYDFVKRFYASTEVTMKDKLIDAGHGSMTILVQRLVAVAACLCDLVPAVADVFGASGVSQSIQGILPTGAVPYYMVGISIITELARRRTL